MDFQRRSAVGCLVCLSTASAQSITGLGILAGTSNPLPRGVSEGGAVVVGQASMPGVPVTWRWTASGGLQNLGYAGYAFGVSADGSVVVGQQGSGPSQAIRWTAGAGVQGLGWLSAAHDQSSAWAASEDGSVVVGRSFVGTTQSEAFRWTAGGGMVGMSFLPGDTYSLANSVSADGSVVAGTSYIYQPGGGYPQQAFRWTAGGGMVGIGYVPGRNASAAAALSADGTTIVGGSYTVGTIGLTPFRWTQSGGMQALASLPGYNSCGPTAVSADGSIVIGWCQPGAAQAFIWTAGTGTRSLAAALLADYGLNVGPWQLTTAFAISPDGRAIVGAGTNPAGVQEPFLILLPAACYANCDASTTAPMLNIADFTCFLNRFATGDTRANCDASSTAPVLNIADFTCFLNRFAAGCS